MLALNRRGDTIVEVMIAIAIVSLVLTAAYVISSRNTIAIQSNQERIQAQHLVEGQIEALRAQGKLNTPGDCFDSSGVEIIASACNNFTAAGSGAIYQTSISGPISNVYTIQVRWSSLQGQATNDSNVTMYYRLD